MRFAKTHDGHGFVLYVDQEPPGPHIRSYLKIVLSPNRADALHRALTAFLAENAPPTDQWIPGSTDG